MEFLKEWVAWIFGWVRDTCYSIVGGLVEIVIDAFPSIDISSNLNLGYYYEVADGWAPLSEFFVLWGAHLIFMSTIIAVRWIIKITPFVGG